MEGEGGGERDKWRGRRARSWEGGVWVIRPRAPADAGWHSRGGAVGGDDQCRRDHQQVHQPHHNYPDYSTDNNKARDNRQPPPLKSSFWLLCSFFSEEKRKCESVRSRERKRETEGRLRVRTERKLFFENKALPTCKSHKGNFVPRLPFVRVLFLA